MNSAFLLIGGNIGDRLKNLHNAAEQIKERAGTIITMSSIYETAAWGVTDQPAFLNQVILISTALTAHELLGAMLQAEQALGRKRLLKMGPRTIDIDILFYNNDIINTTDLTVPHPRIESRRFVLTPLCQIAADFKHPVSQKTMAELLAICPDELEVKLFK